MGLFTACLTLPDYSCLLIPLTSFDDDDDEDVTMFSNFSSIFDEYSVITERQDGQKR